MRWWTFIAASALCFACCSKPEPAPYTLASGKQVKLVKVGKMWLSGSDPIMTVTYQTDTDLADKAKLGVEAEEVWASFQGQAEKDGLSNGMVQAVSPPTGFGVTLSRSQNHGFKRLPDGKWVWTAK